ncbi:MAG: ABC transporter substrate-binding protein [Pseudomonadales bacterium]|nr:ABC transporter substrate-binding protein [Pseudomonadales bacterium]NRA16684.1 ABC transporter substrate-binding protein [Oceanospirillaceae bacterium]
MKMKFQWLSFSCIALVALSSNLTLATEHTTGHTIGVSVWSGYPNNLKGFKDALAESGIIEGDNLKIIYGKSDGDKQKQKDIAESFKQQKVDLVYTLTTPGTSIVKEIMPSSTPIVFSIVTYPADSGLIESFEYSGNNLVGTSNFVPFNLYVNLLTTILPGAERVAIFHRKGEPNSKIQAVNLSRLLRKKGLEVLDQQPNDILEVKKMADSLAGKVDAFITTTDTLMQGGGEEMLIKVAQKMKIPILSSNKKGVEAGSTFGPVADFYTIGYMSGEMAVQILLNKVKPTKIQSRLHQPPLILVNRKSMELLGIEIPASIPNVKYLD